MLFLKYMYNVLSAANYAFHFLAKLFLLSDEHVW